MEKGVSNPFSEDREIAARDTSASEKGLGTPFYLFET